MAGSVPENVIVMWAGTHSDANNLTGWSRETSLDSKMSKGVANASTDAGATGGAASHVHTSASHTHPEASHTHSGTTLVSASANDDTTRQYPGSGGANRFHTHTITTGAAAGPTSGGQDVSWGTGAVEPAYYEVIYIKSDGSGDGFPDDCIVYYNSGTDPTDWTQHSASVDRYFRGAGTGADGGGTGGSSTHTHGGGTHTHSAGNHTHGAGTTTGQTSGFGGGNSGIMTPVYNHPHTTGSVPSSGSSTSSAASSSTSATADNIPPTTKMNAIQNDSGASVWLENAYCLWIGDVADIDSSFTIADGNNSTRNLLGRFLLNEPADNSGHGDESGSIDHGHSSASHTHTAPHSHSAVTIGTFSTVVVFQANNTSPADLVSKSHNHPNTTPSSTTSNLTVTTPTLTSVSDEQPAFKEVLYIMSGEEPASSGNAIMFGANF